MGIKIGKKIKIFFSLDTRQATWFNEVNDSVNSTKEIYVTSLTISFEHNELRALKMKAARQLRTPENLARFMILSQMGFIRNESSNSLEPANANGAVNIRQDPHGAVAA